MTDITPTTAVLELTKLSRKLDELGYMLRPAELDAVHKRHAHSVAYAKAIISADGTNAEIRKAQATLASCWRAVSTSVGRWLGCCGLRRR